MSWNRRHTDEQLLAAIKRHGSARAAARKLGLSNGTMSNRVARMRARGLEVPVSQATAITPELVDKDRKIRELQSEVRRLSIAASDRELIRQVVGKIDAQVGHVPAWTTKTPRAGKLVHGVPTLMLSDLHFGEVVFPAQVNGVNSYNTEIAKRRLRRVVDGSVKLLRNTLSPGEFGGIVVVFGGDMVEGVIHDEIRDTSDETVMQAVITLHDELVPALKLLCDEFGKVHVPCVVGNHGRLDRKPRQKKGPALNFDWLMYQFIARTIGTDPRYRHRITFQIPDGYECSWQVHGVRYMLTHGDSFRGGDGITGPLIPWMRGDLKARKSYSAMGLPYDVLIQGHWHQLRYLGSIIVNGSLVGFNEYAAKNHFSYEPPQQALWLTHPVRGLTFQEAVFAEEPKPRTDREWVSVHAK